MTRPPLPASLPEAHALIEALWARVEALEATVDELRRQLGRNSTNSSKPPSSDGPERQRPSGKPSGRRRGGQPGHKGTTRALVDNPDEIVECKPTTCGACGRTLRGSDGEPERHQVTELPPVRPHVTEYRLHRLECACGAHTTATLPKGVDRRMFGPRLTAFVSWLAGGFALSHRDVVTLLREGFGVDMALGSVAACERAASLALCEPVAEVKAHLPTRPVVFADETGWREQNERAWLWVGVTDEVTLFVVHEDRSRTGAQALFGTSYDGYLITDRWSAYDHHEVTKRQVCWAHLARQFAQMAEARGEMGVVGDALVACTDELFACWSKFRRGVIGRATLVRWMAPIRDDLVALLHQGAACRHALRGRCAELLRLADALFTFVDVEGLEPTNNRAERAVRQGVLWRKNSYGTQSETGSLFLARILTTLATLRQQGRNALAYLVEACSARLHGIAAPSLLPPRPT